MALKYARGVSFKRLVRAGFYARGFLAPAANQKLAGLRHRTLNAVVDGARMIKVRASRLAFGAGVTFFQIDDEFFHNSGLRIKD
jgi:hypothetical protein